MLSKKHKIAMRHDPFTAILKPGPSTSPLWLSALAVQEKGNTISKAKKAEGKLHTGAKNTYLSVEECSSLSSVSCFNWYNKVRYRKGLFF